MITPAAFLIHPVHRPAFGMAARNPEERPTAMSRAVIPSEKTKRYVNPHTGLAPALPTQVSTAPNAGAPHGAATRPLVAPIRNTPPRLPPPKRLAQALTRSGAVKLTTSNIPSAKSSSRFPNAK